MATKRSPPFIPPDVFPAFSPSELCLLQGVVEDSWADLRNVETSPISPIRERLTREILAHRVMAHATQGELDPERLKKHAVDGMTRNKRQKKHAA
jgi:hypothetical protein